MKMKFISIIAVLFVSTAFIVPAYADESAADVVESAESTPIITIVTQPPETVTLPNAVVIPEPIPAETEVTAGLGVIETPRGAGTVLEDVCQTEVSRQFITVQSRGGNVFYIIIDNDRDRENVYFLNAVDDWDLISFSDNFPDGVWEAYEEIKEEAVNNAIAAEIAANSENTEDGDGVSVQKSAPEAPAGNNTQTIILVVVGALFAGGFVYFKFFKGKKKAVKPLSYDDVEYDEDEETEENEESEEN
jgi:hypothetical protein